MWKNIVNFFPSEILIYKNPDAWWWPFKMHKGLGKQQKLKCFKEENNSFKQMQQFQKSS